MVGDTSTYGGRNDDICVMYNGVLIFHVESAKMRKGKKKSGEHNNSSNAMPISSQLY
jgi:hypothetical protein